MEEKFKHTRDCLQERARESRDRRMFNMLRKMAAGEELHICDGCGYDSDVRDRVECCDVRDGTQLVVELCPYCSNAARGEGCN